MKVVPTMSLFDDDRSYPHALPQRNAVRERLTLTTEELAQRWGLHPESLKRAVRNGSSPIRPIIPGAGRWVFSIAAVERVERETVTK